MNHHNWISLSEGCICADCEIEYDDEIVFEKCPFDDELEEY